MENTIKEVCKLLVHLKHPEVLTRLGISPPRGVLLHGPPGESWIQVYFEKNLRVGRWSLINLLLSLHPQLRLWQNAPSALHRRRDRSAHVLRLGPRTCFRSFRRIRAKHQESVSKRAISSALHPFPRWSWCHRWGKISHVLQYLHLDDWITRSIPDAMDSG